mmetsp:Transcript_40029/g.113192  ORF Transcript_40029/g.113192 Transcript_40029/m.113192 type:complete len:381 (+) Transcript_40029:953-2095(+)
MREHVLHCPRGCERPELAPAVPAAPLDDLAARDDPMRLDDVRDLCDHGDGRDRLLHAGLHLRGVQLARGQVGRRLPRREVPAGQERPHEHGPQDPHQELAPAAPRRHRCLHQGRRRGRGRPLGRAVEGGGRPSAQRPRRPRPRAPQIRLTAKGWARDHHPRRHLQHEGCRRVQRWRHVLRRGAAAVHLRRAGGDAANPPKVPDRGFRPHGLLPVPDRGVHDPRADRGARRLPAELRAHPVAHGVEGGRQGRSGRPDGVPEQDPDGGRLPEGGAHREEPQLAGLQRARERQHRHLVDRGGRRYPVALAVLDAQAPGVESVSHSPVGARRQHFGRPGDDAAGARDLRPRLPAGHRGARQGDRHRDVLPGRRGGRGARVHDRE